MTNKFLEQLKVLANSCETAKVPMRLQFGEFTLKVISKVYVFSFNESIINLYFLQVGFGSDFTEQLLNVQEHGLKWAKGNGTPTYLIDTAFKGIDMSLRYPGYRV